MAAVGAPSPRRAAAIPTAPLPAETRRALSGIVQQLRNVPRNLIGDPAEVVHFLGRTARALERLRDQSVLAALPSTPPSSPRPTAPTPVLSSPPRALSARERAEAVFGGTIPPTPGATSVPPVVSTSGETVFRSGGIALPRPRIVMDRKGRGVRVEVRRAREAGQLEMPV